VTETPTSAPADALSSEETRQVSDAINFLYSGQKDAALHFAHGGDAGRHGVILAVENVLKFFTELQRTGICPAIVAEGLQAPLGLLLNALLSLDDGIQSPLLTPKKISGRARGSTLYDGLKAIAVFTVRRLVATGMSLPEARKVVAAELARLQVHPARKGSDSGQVSKRTLRGWQDDIGMNKTMTAILEQIEAEARDQIIAISQQAPPDQRRAWLDKMGAFIAWTRSQETT
jgi:hypothetical protein